MDWWWKGDLLESCNCNQFACSCNYTSLTTHGNCQAILTWWIKEGASGETDLGGLGFAMLLSWPNAIHEGNGHAVAFVDERADDAQRDALAKIGRGEAGAGGPFEVFATMYTEPASVAHGPLLLERDELSARVELSDIGRVEFEPIRDVMDNSPSIVRWVKPSGFLWRDGLTVKTTLAEARTNKVSFRYSDSWGVFSEIAYSARWPDPVIRSYDD